MSLQKKRILSVGYNYELQEKAYIRQCNLCSKEQHIIISQRDRYGFPTQAVACKYCSLTIMNPRMTMNAYRAFYDGIY